MVAALNKDCEESSSSSLVKMFSTSSPKLEV